MDFVSYDIKSNDFRRAGAASRAIKEHLKRIGADAEAIRRTMIAAYEAEMNVVIHARRGRLEASLTDTAVDVNVIDVGPGIPDIEQAMKEGFSTASSEARALGFGAGMGLPNIKRNSDRLRVTSRMGEGTRVSFTVYLKPEATCVPCVISLYASAELCRDCRRCLTACPTGAMRVRNGRPSVLEHLCVDCTQCIAACAPGALMLEREVTSLDQLDGIDDMILAVPPALLAGYGAVYPPGRVLDELSTLGFSEVVVATPFEEALRAACIAHAERADAAAPVIAPVCPAIVNLIELRFPSLIPQLAPFDSPWEALQATFGTKRIAYVVSCPSQRSALLCHESGVTSDRRAIVAGEYLTPEAVREILMPCLAAAHVAPASPAPRRGTRGEGPLHDGRVLAVTGIRHVVAALEQIENGLLNDVGLVEPYACDGGCFGSALLAEDPYVASNRWERYDCSDDGADRRPDGAGPSPSVGHFVAGDSLVVARRRPYAARPGIRLDEDMARAIEKLTRLQAVVRTLPGKDCGACGAPTCAALAEDVVMERATREHCPYIDKDEEDSSS